MKLKALILQKFLNKYQSSSYVACEGLTEFIEKELDQIFSNDKFREQDLVTIDRRVRNYIKASKLNKANEVNSQSKTNQSA